jgi:CubicO group peptidase (beta-lactamase class C family)
LVGADHSLLYQFETASDQVQFILDHPMNPKKINTFNYDSGLTHLLSAIIKQKTGMTAFDYANKKIFNPIGIKSVTWNQLHGVNNGGYGILMTPRDMARFGYLYLNKGNWNGQQILPADWVETSVKQHLLTGRSADEGYGYFFWTFKSNNGYDITCAMGDKGQYIFLIPKFNLLIVTTSANWEDLDIIDGYVVPSIKSSDPIAVNQKANERLAKLEKKK